MSDMVKKYVPFAGIIAAVFFLVPMIFMADAIRPFNSIAYLFVFPVTAIVCSMLYCSKYGMDFLFALIAPIIFIPVMFIFKGGFTLESIILLIAYLVSGILGLFLGDIVLGDKRREQEKVAEAETEEMMLAAKRRDEENRARREAEAGKSDTSKPKASYESDDDDDFDYSKYVSDIDKGTDDELEDILSEYGSSKRSF